MNHKPLSKEILFHDETPDSNLDLTEIRLGNLYVSKLLRTQPRNFLSENFRIQGAANSRKRNNYFHRSTMMALCLIRLFQYLNGIDHFLRLGILII